MARKSIIIWTIAFLGVDLLFWILIGVSCIRDAISCQENAMFGAYFYYLPFTLLPWAVPLWLYSIAHAALGAVIGWLLRNHPVRWWLAGLIAGAVLIGGAYALSSWQVGAELKRETKTQLWLVENASKDELEFSIARQQADGSIQIEDGRITFMMAAYDTSKTVVSVLNCPTDSNCTETVDLTYTDYLVAKTTCRKTPPQCLYSGLASFPMLFEVTSNPSAILTMQQQPVGAIL